jgi:hypothetical protein
VRRIAARCGLAALVVTTGCALLAGGAVAASGSEPNDTLQLKRGRYEINVGNLGQTVALTVESGALRSLSHIASTSYVVHGTATQSRLQADFGELGEISMRFHPSRHHTWEKPHRNCRGAGRFLVRHGTWRGRLRFRGEGGYLSLDLHRASGAVETIAPQCRKAGKKRHGHHKRHGHKRRHHKRHAHHRGHRHRHAHRQRLGEQIAPSQEPGLGKEVPVLQARWRSGVNAAEFVGGASREGSNFFAATQEARGRVAVFRAAHAEGRTRAMRADGALTEATLAPPLPFHGSGSFDAAPDGSRSWEGPLYVTFPGAPDYALTGGPFNPTLKLFPELLVSLIGVFAGHEKRPGPPSGLPCPAPTIGLGATASSAAWRALRPFGCD